MHVANTLEVEVLTKGGIPARQEEADLRTQPRNFRF